MLQNNGGDDLPVSANGTFNFSNEVTDGSQYAVSVLTQPDNPDQVCTVNKGTGTPGGAPVSDVSVICSEDAYTVSGMVSGYTGSGLVLQNNAGDNLPVSANGTFNFSNAVTDGNNYTVTVLTQPGNLNQTCAINNGNGIINGIPVSTVSVLCSTTLYCRIL